MLKFTGAGPFTVTIPSVSKAYLVWNACAGAVTLTTGAGATVTIDAGDIVLMRGDLRTAALAIALARRTMRTMQQNLFWAFVYNVIGIPVAAGVLYPAFGLMLSPILASAAMAFSSVSVVSNSLRLRRFATTRPS